MAYTLVSGAIKNVGDFLIYEKAKNLLKKHTGENKFIELKRWENFDGYLDEINRTKAIIICGGPGYAKNFYPGMYPFLKSIEKIKVPIIPFGLGWSGKPMQRPDKFSFSDSSLSVLKYIHKNCEVTSCRDVITKGILNRYGFRNVMMTGDPALYDLENIGKKFEEPKNIERIAVSAAQNVLFHKQNVNLMKVLKRLFPESEFYCVFHRGIEHDEFTPEQEVRNLQRLKNHAVKIGYTVVNAAYDTSNIEFYRECDLHVGYRVHAHVFFLSLRKPTFLLQEDGRGLGLSRTLELQDVSACSPKLLRLLESFVPLDILSVANYLVENNIPIVGQFILNKRSIQNIIDNVRTEIMNGFSRFQGVFKLIDEYHKTMIKFLKTLP